MAPLATVTTNSWYITMAHSIVLYWSCLDVSVIVDTAVGAAAGAIVKAFNVNQQYLRTLKPKLQTPKLAKPGSV
jgi:hypothetical protein